MRRYEKKKWWILLIIHHKIIVIDLDLSFRHNLVIFKKKKSPNGSIWTGGRKSVEGGNCPSTGRRSGLSRGLMSLNIVWASVKKTELYKLSFIMYWRFVYLITSKQQKLHMYMTKTPSIHLTIQITFYGITYIDYLFS